MAKFKTLQIPWKSCLWVWILDWIKAILLLEDWKHEVPHEALNKLKEKLKCKKLNACKVVFKLLISNRYTILAQKENVEERS